MANLIKVSMNITNKTADSIENIQKMTKCSNKTIAVAVSVQIAECILDQIKNGKSIILRDSEGRERELTLLIASN